MITTALLAFTAAPLLASEDPLKWAVYSHHISGPELEPGDLEDKVVLLEYFGHW